MKARLAALVLLAGIGTAQAADPGANQIAGTIRVIHGSVLLLETRTGSTVQVDAAEAMELRQTTPLQVGRPVIAVGTRAPGGVLHATAISRAKPSPALWPADQ